MSRLLKFSQNKQYLMVFTVQKYTKRTQHHFWWMSKCTFLNYLNIIISCIFCSKLDQFLSCSGGIYFLQVEIQANGQYFHNEHHQWVLQLAPFVFGQLWGIISWWVGSTNWSWCFIGTRFRKSQFSWRLKFQQWHLQFLGTFCWWQWRHYNNQAFNLAIQTKTTF